MWRRIGSDVDTYRLRRRNTGNWIFCSVEKQGNEIVGFVLKSWKLTHQHVLLIRQDVQICTLLHLVFTLDSHFLLAEQGKRWRKRKMP